MREFVQVTTHGGEPHPELVSEMKRLGLNNKRGMEECIRILHETKLGIYRNLAA